jgi:hypothetical protein
LSNLPIKKLEDSYLRFIVYVNALIIAIGSLTTFACNDSGFGGGTSRRFAGQVSQDPISGQDKANQNDSNSPNGSDGDDSLNGNGGASDGKIDSLQDCKKSGIDNVNIVLIFDASTSQRSTDPSIIRKSASEQFVRKLATEISKGETSTVSIATIYFNSSANVAQNRWVTFDDAASAEKVIADIGVATSSLRSGTRYAPALRQANDLLREKGTSISAQNHRNYVVFLTDGRPQF